MHVGEHRGNPLPEDLIRQVRRLRWEGSSIRGIARQMNLAKASVEKYAVGIHLLLSQAPPPRSEPVDDPIPSGDDEAQIDRLLNDFDLLDEEPT